MVDQHLADIVSNSWGMFNEGRAPTAWLHAYHQVMVQAAAEGIGMYFCALDDGDTSRYSGSAQPVYPASDPMVTGIGGISLAIDSTGGYQFETGWGSPQAGVAFDADGNPVGYDPAPPGMFYGGTGGGVSTIFRQPEYQRCRAACRASTAARRCGSSPTSRPTPIPTPASGSGSPIRATAG